MSDSNSNSGGVGVLGLLGVVFVTLKLTHTIDWSWWWVTAPFWGPAALLLVIAALAGVVIGVGKGLEAIEDKKAEKARQQRRADRLRKL